MLFAVCQAKDVTFEICVAVAIIGVAWAAAYVLKWFLMATNGYWEETTVVEERVSERPPEAL